MKKQFAILTAALSISLAGCLEDWLVTTPQTILTDEQIYSDVSLIQGMLADYYDRISWNNQHVAAHGSMTAYGEAMTSEAGAGNSPGGAPNVTGPGWNWGLMRDIHVTMAGVQNSTAARVVADRPQILAELRFIRAMVYFTMARAYGGVPLITEQLIYDFSGDTSPVQVARATEAATYDFILSEVDAVMDQLGNAGIRTRANRGSAHAFKSRVALYAASVARYNNEMVDPLTTPGGEAGIPASRAVEYFTTSLAASEALITGAAGSYSLVTGPDASAAFASIFTNKTNPEVIMAKDYSAAAAKIHHFTLRVVPESMFTEKWSNWGTTNITPTLNVLESFDRLDGSSGRLVSHGLGTVPNPNAAAQAGWTFYPTLSALFDGYDARMRATVIPPGGRWIGGGKESSLLAGVYNWNGTSYTQVVSETPGATFTDGGLLRGQDGPTVDGNWVSRSGLLMHKFLDPAANAQRFAPGGDTQAIWFRLGEIYLNAAEAAFELGQTAKALGYINTLRQRAGFPPNSLAVVNREVIRKERENELRYEDHFMWDQKRWRNAHLRWTGDPTDENNRMLVIFPYRISRPGHPNHNTYVFNRYISGNNTQGRGAYNINSYYDNIPGGARDGNPLLVCNPGQTC